MSYKSNTFLFFLCLCQGVSLLLVWHHALTKAVCNQYRHRKVLFSCDITIEDWVNYNIYSHNLLHNLHDDYLSLAWSDIREIVPFSPFVPCVSACALSNTYAYTVFSAIFPFAWRNLTSAQPSEWYLVKACPYGNQTWSTQTTIIPSHTNIYHWLLEAKIHYNKSYIYTITDNRLLLSTICHWYIY